jgi:hypothetical protein
VLGNNQQYFKSIFATNWCSDVKTTISPIHCGYSLILKNYIDIIFTCSYKKLCKKRLQFRYILSQGFSQTITAQSYLNYTYSMKQQNNCTIIRYWLHYLFEESCLALRSNILRVLIGGFFQPICLLAIIFCGCFNGII